MNRRTISVTLLLTVASVGLCRSQEKVTRFELPNYRTSISDMLIQKAVIFRVRNGEAVLRPVEALNSLPPTEGWFLGLKLEGPSEAPRYAAAFRVRIESIHAGTVMMAAIGENASAELKPNMQVMLLRNAGTTTQQMQKLPDWMAVESPGSGENDIDATKLELALRNARQIMIAMHRYHDKHSHFPPAVVHGPDGRPWHSWRVLILPYMGHEKLFASYRWNEPWDGPNNKRLLPSMPAVFRDPVQPKAKGDFTTDFAAIVGETTAFPTSRVVMSDEGRRPYKTVPGSPYGYSSFRAIMDGTSNAIAIGSVSADRKIPWMKPEDMQYRADFPSPGGQGGFAANYGRGRNAYGVFGMCDGSSKAIGSATPAEQFRRLLEIRDGKPIDREKLRVFGQKQTKGIPVLVFRAVDGKTRCELVFD